MEFLLSWLADSVELGDHLPLAADAAGRHRLLGPADEAKTKTLQIGEKLTAVGLAVEGLAERPWDADAMAERGSDFVLEVDVTSNRPDCMNHFGLARELAVALGTSLRPPVFPFYGSLSSSGVEGEKVVLEDPESCPRFVARRIRGVRLGPSPEWLRRRLEAIGLRSINNVVDATNFVLWETGQPLHAYDLATIPGGELRVRRARAGETLVTLDGKKRELDPEILVIADRSRPVGLGGIMGGLETEVTGSTTDLLLEAAHFDRRRVRIGAKRLGMHTDASHRFERGADFEGCDAASRRCAALIVELAGGVVEEGAVDAIARRPEAVRWQLSAAELERFAGFAIGDEEIERILGGLGFEPRRAGDRLWDGRVPSWRAVDFEPRRRPRFEAPGPEAWAQDIFEEVLRHVGFDRVPATLPAVGGIDGGSCPAHDLRARARAVFVALGYAEAIHFAFQSRAADERLPVPVRAGAPLGLANPLSERYAVMRRSLVPNLIEAAEFNGHRGAGAVRLFEVGHLFPGGAAGEIESLGAVAGGLAGGPWDRPRTLDLLAFKGAFEVLLSELGVSGVEVRAADLPGIVPGTGAEWVAGGALEVGWFGRVAETDLPFELFAGEILLDRLGAHLGPSPVEAPSRFPSVAADLTLTHSAELPWAGLEAAVRELATVPCVGFRLKDRWSGAGLPEGAVATTITFEYNAGERSLTQEEVNALQGALASELERRFGRTRENAS